MNRGVTAGTPTTTQSSDRDRPAAEEGLWEAWDEFFSALRRARGRAAAAHPEGELTLSQYRLAEAIDAGGGTIRTGELAGLIGVAQPTATRMLDGLERDGVVARNRCREDGRAVEVALTAHGHELYERKQERVLSKRRELFESLSVDERAQLEPLLRRLADGLEAL